MIANISKILSENLCRDVLNVASMRINQERKLICNDLSLV